MANFEANICTILILDTSGSMRNNSFDQALIRDTKTFLDLLRPGDKFAIVGFDSNSYNIYPNNMSIATVDGVGSQVTQAQGALDNLRFAGSTNMEAGVTMANELAKEVFEPGNSNFLRPNFLLISDGYENQGSDVKKVLPQLIPVNTCAIGQYSDTGLLRDIARDTQAQYYFVEHQIDMARVFFDMHQQNPQVEVIINEQGVLEPNGDYMNSWLLERYHSNIVCVTWDDTSLTYTDNTSSPQVNEVGIWFLDIANGVVEFKPSFVGEGYVVYEIENLPLSLFHFEIVNGKNDYLTVGVAVLAYIESKSAGIRLNVNAIDRDSKNVSEPLAYTVSATQNGTLIKDIDIQASVRQLVYSGPYQPNKKLSDDDVLRVRKYAVTHQGSAKEGTFVGKLRDAKGEGTSLVTVKVTGNNSEGKPFQRTKLITL